ncbi:14 kDa phosphohistidine phosphatase isoform X1 [Cuculus canorus]|uniref:14 kDa phosphohistidine phosphatase isoform X1 n=1 Tax=Cuculus canorus TaxID=55661 RepID=UPI0023AB558D|nr:14 kDa phosphohistidine phosphatase isoform X1 [Cuculus canorus]
MAAEEAVAALAGVADVEIDGDGVFKYVLVRVRAAGGPGKDVVRGHGWAEYHGEGRGHRRAAPGMGSGPRAAPGTRGSRSRPTGPSPRSRPIRANGGGAGAAGPGLRVPGGRPPRPPPRGAEDPRLRLLGGLWASRPLRDYREVES